MRARVVRWKTSITVGRLLVMVSCLGLIGLTTALVHSSPAFGAGSTSTPAFAGATRYEKTDSRIVKSGAWSDFAKSAASAGSYGRSSTSGAKATIYFNGTRIDWIAMKGITTGIADVYLDGIKQTTVNLAASTAKYQADVWSSGTLADGSHHVDIVRDAASASGKYLTLDAFDVAGTIASAPSSSPPPANTGTKVFDVTSYGAKGDGTADDANAIQNAVNAAKAAGGGVVYLPAGTYRLYAARALDPDLGANIELFDNVTVKGAGPSATVVVADRDFASAFGAFKRSNVTVQDLTVTAGASQQDGVKFGICTSPLVQNVVAHDIYIGIALYSCIDGVARNCKVYDCSGAGIWIGQGESWTELSIGGVMEDCEGWGTNFTSFRVAGKVSAGKRATGVTLRRCYSHTNGTVNFLFTYSANVTVDGCTSAPTGYMGIRFSGVAGATVTGSTAPFVSTASNDPSMYATYGASSSIVVQ